MAVSDWSANPVNNVKLNGYSLSGPYGHVLAVMMAEVKEKFDEIKNNPVIPVGAIVHFSSSQVPSKYLVCDGSAVSRADYSDLFSVTGTLYGSGDGSTTFNLPNLIQKFVEGAASSAVGTAVSAGLPNITGDLGYLLSIAGTSDEHPMSEINADDSALIWKSHGVTKPIARSESTEDVVYNAGINASRSSSIYGSSNTVQPSSLKLLPCIKAVL